MNSLHGKRMGNSMKRLYPLALLGLLAACGGDAGNGGEAAKGGGAAPKGGADSATTATAAAPGDDRSTVGNEAIRARAPQFIRGLYLNAYAAGSRTRLPKLLAMADETEINAFVIDVKDEKGIRYQTTLELPKQLAQEGEVAIRNLPALMDTLKAHKIWTIASIVVFKDPILSKAQPD